MSTTTVATDYTSGNIYKQLIYLSLPLIAGNILQQLYNTADSYIAGHYISSSAFVTVGLAGNIMNLIIFMIVGYCNGITVIYSQLYGQKNWSQIRRESFFSLLLGLIFSLAISIISILLSKTFLMLMHTPSQIMADTQRYLTIVLSCLFVTYLYNWSSSILRGFGNTRIALYILAFSIILNIILDLIFVIIFEFGITGTAAATIVSQLCSAILCLGYLYRKYPFIVFSRNDISLESALIRTTMNYGLVSALHQSSLYIGKLLIQSAVNHSGMEVLTAFTASARIEGLINSFGDSGSAAISIIVGQNHGAGNHSRIRECLFKSMKLMVCLCLFLSAIMILTTRTITSFLIEHPNESVADQTFWYIFIIAFFYVFCFTGNTFVGLFRGIGMVHVPTIGTILQMTVRVIMSYLLIRPLQLSAVAVASGFGWIAVNLYQLYIYRRRVSKSLAVPEALPPTEAYTVQKTP